LENLKERNTLQDVDKIEDLLKVLLAKLNSIKKQDEKSHLQQLVLRHMIRHLVKNTDSTLESLLNDSEAKGSSQLNYSEHLKHPVFSHLRRII